MKNKDLLTQYENICNQIVVKFAAKQKLEFDYWIADEIGGIACFANQYYINFSDIILDLKTRQKKGLILDWQDDYVEFNHDREVYKNINYKSYTIGLRFEDLENN